MEAFPSHVGTLHALSWFESQILAYESPRSDFPSRPIWFHPHINPPPADGSIERVSWDFGSLLLSFFSGSLEWMAGSHMSGCADSYQECVGDSSTIIVVDPGDHLASDSNGNILFCKTRSSEFPTNLNPPDPASKCIKSTNLKLSQWVLLLAWTQSNSFDFSLYLLVIWKYQVVVLDPLSGCFFISTVRCSKSRP